MAEEAKKEEKKQDKNSGMIFKVLLGLAFLVFGGWALHRWWWALLIVGKGFIGLVFILAGIITLAIAKE